MPLEHRLLDGQAVAEILRVARGTKSDVIVLGTHGRTGLSCVLIGSVAEQVVRKATCPVVTVRAPLPGSRPFEERALEKAGSAAGATNG